MHPKLDSKKQKVYSEKLRENTEDDEQLTSKTTEKEQFENVDSPNLNLLDIKVSFHTISVLDLVLNFA